MFEEEIKNLLSLRYEGGYWDYKSDYPDTKEEKLHDIICMANNLENRDAYLIYGANNDGTVCGIENTKKARITSLSLIQFLRTKSFAGGYVPNVEVKVLYIENHELDIVVIRQSDKTPYYLNKDYIDKQNNDKIVKAGVVYTRTADGNTPMHEVANIEHTEYLWRKRFGYDLCPSKRFELLLKDYTNWSEANWDSCRHAYYIPYPEFQIVVDEHDSDARGYEQLRFFYDDPTMFFAPLKLTYLGTVLYETEIWYMDCGRCIIPCPKVASLGNSYYRYYYFRKDSFAGKLIGWFTNGRFECHDRKGLPVPIMFFENAEEQNSFEMLFNEKDLIETITDELQNNAIIQHRINIEEFECKGKPCCGVMEVAVPFELYKRWRDSDRVN